MSTAETYEEMKTEENKPMENNSSISDADWLAIMNQCSLQLQTSRDFKRPRMKVIQENENLYMGIAEKEYKNPYNDCYPYMSGFCDYLLSEIDDAPNVIFSAQGEEDYKAATRTTALFEQLGQSKLPNANWSRKDRASKKLAIFSGVGILEFYSEANPDFKTYLNNVDHYDFHCEPDGGSDLEGHLFCGREGIYKTKEQIEEGATSGRYNPKYTKILTEATSAQQFKDNVASHSERLNRSRAMNLDVESNNYVGQEVFALVEFYTTYKGKRYYCLFDDFSKNAIRIELLSDMFSVIEPNTEALYPYVAWHTNEDPRVFWSKGPADDARPVAKTINKLLNQQMYNRDKQNMGHRLYDPQMIKDIKSLGEWRVDGLTPVNTRNGQNAISSSVHTLQTGNLQGTVEMVQFLNNFVGQQIGSTPGSKGDAPSSQAVGIFRAELAQISKRLGVYNKSYTEMWAGIGLRFRVAITDNLTENKVRVKIMGAKGIEWADVSAEDLEPIKDYDILIEGGRQAEAQRQEENKLKASVLDSIQTVNPKWKDIQKLRAVGFDEEQIKEAFSIVDPGLKELLSEAAQAEQEIVEGGKPALNRGANAAFMQHIINFAQNLTLEDKEKEAQIAIELMEYAVAHASIAAANEARNALQLIKDATIKNGTQQINSGAIDPNAPVDPNAPTPLPPPAKLPVAPTMA